MGTIKTENRVEKKQAMSTGLLDMYGYLGLMRAAAIILGLPRTIKGGHGNLFGSSV